MSLITFENKDGVAVITLNRMKANALNGALVAELRDAVKAVADDGNAEALVLTSACPGFFCVGFDAKEVFAYDREAMKSFWHDFVELYETLFRMPKPTVAALTGHTYAGGAVLALACDVRLMADARVNFAVSGVNIGLALPEGVMAMAKLAAGDHMARHLLLTGEPLLASDTYRHGICVELDHSNVLQERALDWARRLAGKGKTAYARLKADFQSVVPNHGGEAELEAFLDQWFSEESRANRNALTNRLENS